MERELPPPLPQTQPLSPKKKRIKEKRNGPHGDGRRGRERRGTPKPQSDLVWGGRREGLLSSLLHDFNLLLFFLKHKSLISQIGRSRSFFLKKNATFLLVGGKKNLCSAKPWRPSGAAKAEQHDPREAKRGMLGGAWPMGARLGPRKDPKRRPKKQDCGPPSLNRPLLNRFVFFLLFFFSFLSSIFRCFFHSCPPAMLYMVVFFYVRNLLFHNLFFFDCLSFIFHVCLLVLCFFVFHIFVLHFFNSPKTSLGCSGRAFEGGAGIVTTFFFGGVYCLSTGHARIWPNRIWPKPHLAKKIRIWPICFRDRIWPNRIWPELVFQSVDRIWPNRIWPILVF